MLERANVRAAASLVVSNWQSLCELVTQGPVSRSPCALLKLDFLTNAMHLLYALVRKSSFSKAQGFVKPAPDRDFCEPIIFSSSGLGRGELIKCRGVWRVSSVRPFVRPSTIHLKPISFHNLCRSLDLMSSYKTVGRRAQIHLSRANEF